MTIVVDLPKNVIERIYEFQTKQYSGSITLNIHEGRIQSYESRQVQKVKLSTLPD